MEKQRFVQMPINGYIKMKKTAIDLTGKKGIVPIEDINYGGFIGTLKIDENGDTSVYLQKGGRKTDFVLVASKNKETGGRTVYISHHDIRGRLKSMYFEEQGNKASVGGAGVFSSNECDEIQFSEYVETLSIEGSLTTTGGKMKIKGRVEADPYFKYLITVEVGIATQFDA